MRKTSIDELIEAIAVIQSLKTTIANQDQTITLILNRLDAIEKELGSRSTS